MTTLGTIITSTQERLTSILSQEMNSVDDREEQDMALEQVEKDIQCIADQIFEEPQFENDARELATFLRDEGQESMAKDLEISLGYLSHNLEKAKAA